MYLYKNIIEKEKVKILKNWVIFKAILYFSKIVDFFALNYDFLHQAVQTNSIPSKNHEIGIWNFFSHGYMFVKKLIFFMFRPL